MTSLKGPAGWIAALVFPLVLSACAGSTTSAPSTTPAGVTTTTGATATTTATPGRGCGQQADPGTVTLNPTVDGRPRLVIVHLPAGYSPTSRQALVLNMHGSRSTAVDQEGLTGMDATADADHFIVAYPQGDIPAGSGFEWNVPGQPLFGEAAVPRDAPDDVAFLEHLVTLLESRYCIDPHQVYATGFSGGARMASQLGCDASTVFAAVAPVSGLRQPTPCPSTRPMPVVSFHGTADPVDPYGGNGQKYWSYSVPVAAQRWATHNGCAAPAATRPAATVQLATFSGCSGGATVELYTIVGEGHEWPGGPRLPRSITRELGPQSTAIDADTTMWAFFEAHPLP